LNESFATRDDSEEAKGKLFRSFSKSRFLSYVRTATFATDEYPGPVNHFEVICQNHVIEVVSTEAPRIRRIARPGGTQGT
jgi:hypothetical protein